MTIQQIMTDEEVKQYEKAKGTFASMISYMENGKPHKMNMGFVTKQLNELGKKYLARLHAEKYGLEAIAKNPLYSIYLSNGTFVSTEGRKRSRWAKNKPQGYVWDSVKA